MYKDYNMNQITLPMETEVMIPENDISRAVHTLVESIPEDVFDGFRQTLGASSYHPKMMLKIILCAYSQSTFSGRAIEDLLHDSIRMMWLAQNQTPSYRTINQTGQIHVWPSCFNLHSFNLGHNSNPMV